jgi:heme oxygenase
MTSNNRSFLSARLNDNDPLVGGVESVGKPKPDLLRSVSLPQNEIMSLLRQSTLVDHRLAEEALGPRICESRIAYRSLLARLAGFYSVVESDQSLNEAWLSIGIDPRFRRKSHLLAADVAALDGPVISFEKAALPDLKTRAGALGCLYVLEGATLGGQVICRLVRDRHGSDFPCTFFAGYGRCTGAMWRDFGNALRVYAASNLCNEEIVFGARQTFQSLTLWLTSEKRD